MKVNLPISNAPSRVDTSAKLTGQPETETISPFSAQMNQIMRQKEDRDGVPEGRTHPRSRDSQAEEEDSGSISACGLQANPSDISGSEGSAAKKRDESKQDVRAGQVISKKDESIVELNSFPGESGKGISSSNESGLSVKSPAGTDRISMNTAKSENIPSPSQSTDNGRSLGRISEQDGSGSAPEGEKEERHVHVDHEKTGADRSESEKVGRLNPPAVEDPSKNGDSARKMGVSRIGVSSDSEISIKTPERNTDSGGENRDSRDNSNQMAAARSLVGNAVASKTSSGKDSDSIKAFRVGEPAGTANHVSAGSAQVSGSHSPAGMNPVKPITPNSNEFLSRITERIQFLVRDGGSAVRIRLQPDEFGNLEIRAESTARGMAVRIVAEAGSVKSILENNLHILQQNLHELGLKVDRIQVDLHDFHNAQSYAGYSSKSGHSNSGQNEKGGRRDFEQHENSPESANPIDTDAGAFSQDERFYTVA